MNKSELAQADVAIGISYNVQVGDGQSLVLQTHCLRDDPLKDLNQLLDKLHSAGDRQALYGKIDVLDMEIERTAKMEEDLDGAITRIDSELGVLPQDGHRAIKLSDAKQAERNNALKSLDFQRKVRQKHETKRAMLLAKLSEPVDGE